MEHRGPLAAPEESHPPRAAIEKVAGNILRRGVELDALGELVDDGRKQLDAERAIALRRPHVAEGQTKPLVVTSCALIRRRSMNETAPTPYGSPGATASRTTRPGNSASLASSCSALGAKIRFSRSISNHSTPALNPGQKAGLNCRPILSDVASSGFSSGLPPEAYSILKRAPLPGSLGVLLYDAGRSVFAPHGRQSPTTGNTSIDGNFAE